MNALQASLKLNIIICASWWDLHCRVAFHIHSFGFTAVCAPRARKEWTGLSPCHAVLYSNTEYKCTSVIILILYKKQPCLETGYLMYNAF